MKAIDHLSQHGSEPSSLGRTCYTGNGFDVITAASMRGAGSALRKTTSARRGMEAFAERARRELSGTGETVRKRTVETRDVLTPQERQIAGAGSRWPPNPEIGAPAFFQPAHRGVTPPACVRKLGSNPAGTCPSALARSSPSNTDSRVTQRYSPVRCRNAGFGGPDRDIAYARPRATGSTRGRPPRAHVTVMLRSADVLNHPTTAASRGELEDRPHAHDNESANPLPHCRWPADPLRRDDGSHDTVVLLTSPSPRACTRSRRYGACWHSTPGCSPSTCRVSANPNVARTSFHHGAMGASWLSSSLRPSGRAAHRRPDVGTSAALFAAASHPERMANVVVGTGGAAVRSSLGNRCVVGLGP